MGDDGDETKDVRVAGDTRTGQDDDEPVQRDATGRKRIVDEITDLMEELHFDDVESDDGRGSDDAPNGEETDKN